MSHEETLNRWRLILGKQAGQQISFGNGAALENGISCFDLEDALEFLYSREYGEDVRREGGTGASRLTAATWITKIRSLFPKKTVEILERHALERYQLTELLTDREVLERLEPNEELLKTILQLKHLMRGDVLDAARRIVRKVAEEIAERLNRDIRRSLLGSIDRNSESPVKSIRNLDMKKTIRRNLKHYDREQKPLFVFSVENIRYQLRYPNPAGIIFSHLPEQWLQRNQQTSERRAWALQRLARTMNGEPDLLVDPWNDHRYLIAESLPISTFVTKQDTSTEPVLQDKRSLLMRHLENPLLTALCQDDEIEADSYECSCDQRGVIMASLLTENKILLKKAQIEQQEVRSHVPVDHRGELASALFAEQALAVYGQTAYGRLYSVKMRTMSVVRRTERKAVLWLHKHRSVYQLLTGLGVKRFYINCKRRKKK